MNIIGIKIDEKVVDKVIKHISNTFLINLNEFDINDFISLNYDNRKKKYYFLDKIEDQLEKLGYPQLRRKDIIIAIDELLTNSLNHGVKKPHQRFIVNYKINKFNVVIKIKQNVKWQLLKQYITPDNSGIITTGLQLVWLFSNGNISLEDDGKQIDCIFTRDVFYCEKRKSLLESCVIFKPNGMLDEDDSRELKDNIYKCLDNGTMFIIIDISEIERVCSANLRLFAFLLKDFEEKEYGICFIGRNTYFEYLLNATNLIKVMELFEDQEQAIEYFIQKMKN